MIRPIRKAKDSEFWVHPWGLRTNTPWLKELTISTHERLEWRYHQPGEVGLVDRREASLSSTFFLSAGHEERIALLYFTGTDEARVPTLAIFKGECFSSSLLE
jgi:hypothetical protein